MRIAVVCLGAISMLGGCRGVPPLVSRALAPTLVGTWLSEDAVIHDSISYYAGGTFDVGGYSMKGSQVIDFLGSGTYAVTGDSLTERSAGGRTFSSRIRWLSADEIEINRAGTTQRYRRWKGRR